MEIRWTIREELATEPMFQRLLANENTRIGLDHATERNSQNSRAKGY